MKKSCSAVISVLSVCAVQLGRADSTWEYSVQVSAAVQTSPSQIILAWPQDTVGMPGSYTVYRKLSSATSWGAGTALPGTATSYTDSSVAVGNAYEYQIVKVTSGYTGYGYIYAGIQAPLVESRGKVILIVDNTHAVSLAAELTRLQQDLAGDGWTVIRHDVARNDSVVNVKNLIRADYNTDTANVKAVFLFGRVPVPYSGLQNPDGHADHYGAWPADVFYGDMDGSWTDNSVNYIQTVNTDPADAARLSNVPGDGKFDSTTIPSSVELQVGRVDLANMPGRLVWGGPASFPSEVELLRQYLNKDHNFRHKLINPSRRGLVGDYFGVRGGEAFAASGYRNFAPFFGAANITSLPDKGTWIPELATRDYLWAYGCGAGSYSTVGGLGNTGLYNDGTTTEIVNNDTRAVFTLLFGSWLGDWDHEDNIMRSILATRTYGLVCAWSGRPHWFAHHMGLGETIGYTARLTQNNNGLYQNQINPSPNRIHVALMGDPTLRMHVVAPPGTLGGATNTGGVTLTWTPSPESVLGYHVYRATSATGPFTRLTGSLLTTTSFVDNSAPAGATYMVRAAKLENTTSGSYINASQGLFWTVGGAPAPSQDTTPPTISLTSPANNATVSGSAVTVSATASDNVGVVGVQFKLDGANLGAEDLSAPFSVTWNTTGAANGPHTLTAVARDLAANQNTATAISVIVSNAAASTIVWFDDALPAGAGTAASGGDAWTWVSSSPAPFSGTLAHQSSVSAGLHEHYFNWATATLTLNAEDTLFTYVYLDPANPPSELMLGWNADNWEHRAYWGANTIAYGTDGTASRRYLGPLPPAGQWVRLEVPASQVGLEGQTLIGMSFVLYNGRATWDYTGKSSQTTPAPGLPTVTVTASDANASEAGSDPGVFSIARTGSTTTALTVNFTLSGSAINGTDYASPGNSVTIPVGAASATVSVTPTDDTLVEGSETTVLALTTNAAYLVGAPAGATVTIADNDVAPPPDTTAPTVALTAPENNATVSGSTITVSANASDNVGVVGVQFKLDGANLGAEDLASPFSIVWNTTPVANGSHTLTAVARDAAGNQATATGVSVVVSNSIAGTNVVWVEDVLPAGAGGAADGGDAWNWVSSNPTPFSGSLAHQSAIAAGFHDHYFNWATATLTVNSGDTLFAYAYLDASNPPTEVMLAWNTTAGDWEHRAYWGANNVPYGIDGTPSRFRMGALPPAGQWVRLEVPASAVGLEGATLQGMSFVLNDGRATWDYAGKTAPAASTNIAPLPTLTVVASDATATISSSDNAAFTFTRVGDTSAALTVNYALGGTAVKWIDYRRPEGDMPVAVTIPAGAASTTMTIVAVTNTTGANLETVLLTLSTDAAYTIGTPSSAILTILPNVTLTNPPTPITNTVPVASIVDYTTLEMPQPGSSTLHILSPTQLELRLINRKQPDPARVTMWDFVDATGNFQAPALTEFAVTANSQSVVVQAVGFKRRPFYAPLAVRDLRLDDSLILQLATPIAQGQTVEVKNPSGALWPAAMQFITTADPLRYSPAIHVNQEGYVPSLRKQALVGYYLGSRGELDIPASLVFELVDAASGAVAYQGTLTNRPDVGYTYTPTPYQKVLVADFSSFTTPGEYRLVVPGLGASLPFLIDDGIAMAFTRTYALGLYHQRCGTNNALPFTRFTHDVCHFALADVPSPQSNFAFTWSTVSNYALTLNPDNPAQIAPALTNEAAQLYPLVNLGRLDVHGGHHDAGDYSKYTVNSAGLIHSLMFAVDAFPGVAALDNLGIPESGDGISDLMQEAKWEADYLAKIQDADGGFYFLVYPRDREYENNVLPDRGDPQVVWPKTTSATAAAVAALAQCASSPRFKQQYPNEAALYLQKAQLGWQFLMNAIARFGKDGAYQKITHYGDVFTHNDELAWAACEMYLATGNSTYQQKLFEWFPNPNDPATCRWGWWRLWESYGCVVRSYAFAARTGRLASNQLEPTYLSRCETEVKAAGQDALLRAQSSAYGTSFPLETKRVRGGGWYFSSEQAFDITVAYQLDPRSEYLDAILSNLNYEGGANPINVSYITGLGWKRQREIVHQFAQNDPRVLPPDGIPQGNVQSYYSYMDQYGTELNAMCFPLSDATAAPYAFYDRWGDVYNVTTEFVALFQARSLASVAFVATLTPTRTQSWTSATAQIVVPAESGINQSVTATLQAPGVDLSRARIVWEAAGQQPAYTDSFTFTPTNYGAKWVEAEIQLADGRRIFASTNLFTTNDLPTVNITSADATATEGGTDTASFTLTRTGSTASDLTVTLAPTGTAAKWTDYRRPQGDMPDSFIIPAGAASVTVTVVAWDDTEIEGTETATLDIQPSPAYNVGTPYNVTLTLLDNDGAVTPPTVTVSATDANASRVGPDPGVFTISRTDTTSAALNVNYSLGGVAVNGVDYNALGTSVTIPAGAASATLSVMPKSATNIVGAKAVVLTLSANAAYALGSPANATVTIAGNSVPISSIKFTGNGATITWTSTTGKIYRVAYKNGLSDANWTDLSGNIIAVGTKVSWTDSAANRSTQRYYTVYVTN